MGGVIIVYHPHRSFCKIRPAHVFRHLSIDHPRGLQAGPLCYRRLPHGVFPSIKLLRSLTGSHLTIHCLIRMLSQRGYGVFIQICLVSDRYRVVLYRDSMNANPDKSGILSLVIFYPCGLIFKSRHGAVMVDRHKHPVIYIINVGHPIAKADNLSAI